jgi:hypothetical protein
VIVNLIAQTVALASDKQCVIRDCYIPAKTMTKDVSPGLPPLNVLMDIALTIVCVESVKTSAIGKAKAGVKMGVSKPVKTKMDVYGGRKLLLAMRDSASTTPVAATVPVTVILWAKLPAMQVASKLVKQMQMVVFFGLLNSIAPMDFVKTPYNVVFVKTTVP